MHRKKKCNQISMHNNDNGGSKKPSDSDYDNYTIVCLRMFNIQSTRIILISQTSPV
jgi:hypothetical protein